MKQLAVIGVLLACCCLGIQAQEEKGMLPDSFESLEVEGRLLLFMEELDALSANVSHYNREQLRKADKSLLVIDNKWNLYSQANQGVIATDEHLMEIVASYQENKQMVTDSIQVRLHQLDAFDTFHEAESFIMGQVASYQEMHETSQKYSLLEKQAPLLEKLKAKEQLSFEELTGHYETAKSVVKEFPLLNPRMEKIEEQYIELKSLSEKIQKAEYKPFLERAKDYLYSFAAVAILLMFVNMVLSKIQAYKQIRKSAEEYKKMLQKNENEYPSI